MYSYYVHLPEFYKKISGCLQYFLKYNTLQQYF